MVITTVPRARAVPTWRSAAAVSDSGYVRSMTGVIWPESTSSTRAARSAAFWNFTDGRPCPRTNIERIVPAMSRPVPPPVCPPPFGSSVPVDVSARRVSASEWLPTLSRMKS